MCLAKQSLDNNNGLKYLGQVRTGRWEQFILMSSHCLWLASGKMAGERIRSSVTWDRHQYVSCCCLPTLAAQSFILPDSFSLLEQVLCCMAQNRWSAGEALISSLGYNILMVGKGRHWSGGFSKQLSLFSCGLWIYCGQHAPALAVCHSGGNQLMLDYKATDWSTHTGLTCCMLYDAWPLIRVPCSVCSNWLHAEGLVDMCYCCWQWSGMSYTYSSYWAFSQDLNISNHSRILLGMFLSTDLFMLISFWEDYSALLVANGLGSIYSFNWHLWIYNIIVSIACRCIPGLLTTQVYQCRLVLNACSSDSSNHYSSVGKQTVESMLLS